ncbi:MAG: rhomboid family intramembrane serine protease [Halobacteriales archaeon]
MRWPRSPTAELLVLFGLVYLVQQLGGLIGLGFVSFALALPLSVAPWTLITSVYAHASLDHLFANAVALGVVGFALERFTTRLRFHAYVLLTGAMAGLAEVVFGGLLGGRSVVMGASGAVLALYGYVLAGNPVTGGVLDRLNLGRRAKLVLVVGMAVLLTLLTARSGVALVAHATGFGLGLLAGRRHVLRVE